MDISNFPSIFLLSHVGAIPVSAVSFVALVLAVGTFVLSNKNATHSKIEGAAYPPIVPLSPEEQFGDPQAAYEAALAKHGPVIGVPRKGRLEYIVNESLTQTVLTTDSDFSFEEGTATILNFYYLFSYLTVFFKEMDDLVRNGIIERLPVIVDQVFPMFFERAEAAIVEADRTPRHLFDIFEHAHSSIAEAMIIMILGKEYVNSRNLKAAIMVAGDIANVTGLYQNTSVFARTSPSLWRGLAWLHFVFVGICGNFLRVFAPQVWDILRNRRWKRDMGSETDNVIEYLAFKYADKSGSVSVASTIWIFIMMLGLLFASVHQSATVVVWVVFELAKRPEHLDSLREEFLENVDPATLEPRCGDAHVALR